MLKSFQTLNRMTSTSSLALPQYLWCSRSSGASTCCGGIAIWRRSALRSSPAARPWRRGTSTTSMELMHEGGMEREIMGTEIKSMSAIQTLTMARNLKLLYENRDSSVWWRNCKYDFLFQFGCKCVMCTPSFVTQNTSMSSIMSTVVGDSRLPEILISILVIR